MYTHSNARLPTTKVVVSTCIPRINIICMWRWHGALIMLWNSGPCSTRNQSLWNRLNACSWEISIAVLQLSRIHLSLDLTIFTQIVFYFIHFPSRDKIETSRLVMRLWLGPVGNNNFCLDIASWKPILHHLRLILASVIAPIVFSQRVKCKIIYQTYFGVIQNPLVISWRNLAAKGEGFLIKIR